MSKGISANVGGSYQQAKASYVNVNGTWTKFGGGLSWATVSNTPTGTYTGDDGHTYAYYLFESDGTLTVTTAGLLEVLLVGGGGGRPGNLVTPGSGAYLVTGLHPFDAAPHAVTVGAGGSYSDTKFIGGISTLGALSTGVATYGGGGAGTGSGRCFQSVITGEPLNVSGNRQYSTPTPTYGGGGGQTKLQNGQPGVVIAKTRLN